MFETIETILAVIGAVSVIACLLLSIYVIAFAKVIDEEEKEVEKCEK